MVRELVIAAAVQHGHTLEQPFHLPDTVSSPAQTQRRAMYGIDLMLDSDLQPFLLEVTFTPDITRACRMYPDFVNDVFSTMFEAKPSSFTRVC